MATIYYIRERARQGSITSSREVSVADLINLYGSAAGNYEYLHDADSPDLNTDRVPVAAGPDPAYVMVRIDGEEAGGDTFPEPGYYRVREEKLR